MLHEHSVADAPPARSPRHCFDCVTARVVHLPFRLCACTGIDVLAREFTTASARHFDDHAPTLAPSHKTVVETVPGLRMAASGCTTSLPRSQRSRKRPTDEATPTRDDELLLGRRFHRSRIRPLLQRGSGPTNRRAGASAPRLGDTAALFPPATFWETASTTSPVSN